MSSQIDALLTKTVDLARRFPWKPVRPETDEFEALFKAWNVGFARGAQRLGEAVQLLERASHHEEAFLPLRSLIELVGNQGYHVARSEIASEPLSVGRALAPRAAHRLCG